MGCHCLLRVYLLGKYNYISKERERDVPSGPGVGLGAFTAEGACSIPGQGTKIPQVAQYGRNKTKEMAREEGHGRA